MKRDRKWAEEAARELVGKMTLEEKASQLRYQAPAIPRLHIPAYNWWNEALHGVARGGTATVFPQAIGMAASFNTQLMEQAADVISTEGRAKYHAYSEEGDRDIYKGLTFWSPNVNIFRDPRWGRGHETYGEDPYLTAEMGKAFVRGLQGEGKYLKTAACAKHFAVHSGPEKLRHEFDARVSQKDLYETYLPAFEALVKEADVEAVMGAYNRTNGEPCCGSQTLLRKILRGEWGFSGHVVSDCWAIKDFHENHRVTTTATQSAAMALKAGCDVNCGVTYLYLLKAYEDGLVTEEEITEAAVHLFTTRFLLGLFAETEWDGIGYEVVDCKEHQLKNEEMARESCVLLKNDGILPLNRDAVKTIGVVGPNADSRLALIGNYHGTASEYITVLEGIRREAGEDIRILYSEGCHLWRDRVEGLAFANDRISEAVITARHSDVVILCLGLDETLEGEEGDAGNPMGDAGDKSDLNLPKSQQELLKAVAETGKPVILCMLAGSAIDLTYADGHVNAILQAWYPGARGGKAVAELLFGKASPCGKLPVTFYKNSEDLPPFENYSMRNRTYRYMETEPLYPFGYGLTYGDLSVTKAVMAEPLSENGTVLTVEIKNEGKRTVKEVVQVYVKNLDSQDAVPNFSLCAFQKVECGPGERKTLSLSINSQSFTVVKEDGSRAADGTRFQLFVGTSQPDERSRVLTGKEPIAILAVRQ
ncbi:MAG: glycoside hydrolase family 3 C-terminal domain-containing protein [Lachnospiraceae bacterium]